MAVLTFTEMEQLMLDDIQSNVATDPPITTGVANESGRYLNDAYATIWDLSGGRLIKAPSSAAWQTAQSASGTLFGLLTNVADVLRVFATATAPATASSVKSTSVNVVASVAGGFASVERGMHVSGNGIPSNTYVAAKVDNDNLVLSAAATDSNTSVLTYSPVEGATELDIRDIAEVQALRVSSGLGTYATPKVCAVVRMASPGTTDVNRIMLEYWPGSTGLYFPIHYIPQFVPMTASITTPDVNDLESRDIAHLAALVLAPRVGRAELMEAIALKISENTRAGLDRKISAMLDARQDR